MCFFFLSHFPAFLYTRTISYLLMYIGVAVHSQLSKTKHKKKNTCWYKSLTIQSSRFLLYIYSSSASSAYSYSWLSSIIYDAHFLLLCVWLWLDFLFVSLETFIYFYDSGDKIPFFVFFYFNPFVLCLFVRGSSSVVYDRRINVSFRMAF